MLASLIMESQKRKLSDIQQEEVNGNTSQSMADGNVNCSSIENDNVSNNFDVDIY